MSDREKIVTHATLSVASQGIWGAQGFATFIIAGRLLPQKEFGFVVAANAILYGCQCLVLGPVTNPTLRFGAVSRRSLRATYMIYGLVTIIVCVAFLLGNGQIGKFIGRDQGFIALIQYLSIPFAATCLYSVQKIVFFAQMKLKTVVIMDVVFAIANVGGLLLLHLASLFSSALSFYMVRSGAAVAGLIAAVLMIMLSRREPPREANQPFDFRGYFDHSKYSTLSMLSGYGQGQVDVLAVAHFLSPLSAAVYGAAKIFYTGLTMVTAGLVMVVLPASARIVSAGTGALEAYYKRAMLLAYGLLLPAAILLVVFAGPIVHLIFAGRYASAAPIVRIFCIAALILPLGSVTDAVANGAGWFRSASLSALAGSAVAIALSLYLPRAFGLVGAAISPVAAATASALVIVILTWRLLFAARSSTKDREAPPVNSSSRAADRYGMENLHK